MLVDKPLILEPSQNYTFSKYFELSYPTSYILSDLGCKHEKYYLQLPKYEGNIDFLDNLYNLLRNSLLYTSLVNEMARREVLISPILLQIVQATKTPIEIEFPIEVNQYLKGSFDYYLHKETSLIVIEAKNTDIVRGFTQLSVELIALDYWLGSRNSSSLFYGAVTTGEDWKFGIYSRQERKILEDINIYHAPDGLEDLVRVLVGVLTL
ncbi:MAG: hypothetical protein KME30_11765 [Iphinoe sp. HA4291-MV1]|jgi:hypothetical protein|nr:hypothetical protein [Iphinoe sp. HA4291-MV1]